jgi:hypothetical protein
MRICPGRAVTSAGFGVQEVEQDLAFIGLGAGHGERDGQAVEGGDQVQAQSPEVAGVRGAVPVFGPAGQLGVPHGVPGAGALDRGESMTETSSDHTLVSSPSLSHLWRRPRACR